MSRKWKLNPALGGGIYDRGVVGRKGFGGFRGSVGGSHVVGVVRCRVVVECK